MNSLQDIIPSYEVASSIISAFADKRMRASSVRFAVNTGSVVLDLGAGPGVMSRLAAARGGEPILLDVSNAMLRSSSFKNRVMGAFEFLPFREKVFDSVISGFALRDAHDLPRAVRQLAYVLKPGGKLSFCDLGKPDSAISALFVAFYLRTVPVVVGLLKAGLVGLGYGSIFDTYVLALHNSELRALLSLRFQKVKIEEGQLGGSIVVKCSGRAKL